MDVRAQVAMVFHLDKCIGCHTCSIACKNLWTKRSGAEYMWWNNVETKPGTGYPTLWEDQEKYRGGWELRGDALVPRIGGRLQRLANLFHNPYLPGLDDYYEPWTYRYEDLFNAPLGDDQPTARPVSAITGKPIDIEAGPNWDDDLSGSPLYAWNDPGLRDLTEADRAALFEIQRMVFFYVPRICNHCLNPTCLAVCPSGAIYKRGEDGIVLVSQEKCRGWRFCVSGCPYKKTYYNWNTGKAEKCILCFPRLESGQAQACFHSCVGRIRYTGLLLYDAERIEAAARAPSADLVEAQRSIILDPFDPATIAGARAAGIADDWIGAAQASPIYKFVVQWRLALPLHSEFRTLPMLFYVPPLLPVAASLREGKYDLSASDLLADVENTRVPVRYMARLLAAGNEDVLRKALVRLWAVRIFQRYKSVGDIDRAAAAAALSAAGLTEEEVEQIKRLTSLARFGDRFVLPPYHREQAIALRHDPQAYQGEEGFGTVRPPRRGP